MIFRGANEAARSRVLDNRTIVWRDEGLPYDNALYIHLMDAAGNLLDSIEAGAAMTPGILKILTATMDHVDFTFFANDIVYRLSVHESPATRFSFGLPRGFKFDRKLQRHFLTIQELPDKDI